MSQSNTVNNLSQAHVLLVDDDISIRDVSTFILQQNGYAVSMASNGQDALVMLIGSVNSSNPVDLVITDLSMPVMSGVDFIREMRKHDFSMPVVVTTGCIESYSETEIQNIRPDHILFKPFNPANLTYCVKTILGKVQKVHSSQFKVGENTTTGNHEPGILNHAQFSHGSRGNIWMS